MSEPHDTDASGQPTRRRRFRWALWVLGSLFAVLLLLVLAVTWVVNTQSGTRWAVNRVEALMGGKLEIGRVDGDLAGPITVSDIRFNNPDAGADVRVAKVTTDIALRELLQGRVHVQMLQVLNVDVLLSEPKKKEEDQKPFSLEPPIDILLDDFNLRDARVSRDGEEIFEARSAAASGSWTSDGIVIQQFALDSPDGSVRLDGRVAGDQTYTGRARGDFRWKVADVSYMGELSAQTEGETVHATVSLSKPFAARLDATVRQSEAIPWQLRLAVPRFDPRESVLAGGSIQSLAASLNGEGDRDSAEVRGEVALNDKSLFIDPVRVRLDERVLKLEALTLRDPSKRGTLSATGEVRFAAAGEDDGDGGERAAGEAADETGPAFVADLDVRWNGVELPKEWVGQPLLTEGQLAIDGSPQQYAAVGQMSLGPPDRLSDIALSVAGTPEQVNVRRFEILQKNGSLNVTGQVELQPRVAWQLGAEAKSFDPGAIVAGWPGALGFALDTKGRLLERGPEASFNLNGLAGTLRNRRVSGEAALTLTPDMVIAGNLRLRSGRSSITLTGDAGEQLNIVTQFDVASLSDWMPGLGGSMQGRLHVSGKWPSIAVDGTTRGRNLAFDEYSVQAIDVVADVRNPQSPGGSLRVNASSAIAAGFEIANASLVASGDEQSHTVHLEVTGQPLTAELRLQGSREGEDGWKGTLQQLDLAATGIAPVSLREPVNVAWNPRQFSVSQACLTGEQISACATAAQNEAGELTASYTLERLPAGLIAALAAPELPLQFEAVIQGNGDMRRTPEGALFGEAHMTSASGRVSQAGESPRADAADALLRYENLRVDASLAGETARATVSMLVNEGGEVEGAGTVTGLTSGAPAIDARATLNVPDLAPAAVFVPQLANVKGRAEATVEVTGYVSDPQITGVAQLLELAAEVPRVGIRLRQGELRASMQPGDAIEIRGRVTSGDGTLTVNGQTSREGVLNVAIQGQNFQAANIPGATVIITPDLSFERTDARMLLTGEVRIPKASIDLTKLPIEQGGTKASPDVVVIDDETPEEQARQVPLEARVTVILGEDVNLVGFGLDAEVEGRLQVAEKPGSPTTGNGEIRLAGTYKAYGQDLTIEQGRLLYAGQPLADPQINLVATRTVDAVKAILTVSGSAERPQLNVSADPTMSQTQALSYLVTGKPLNEVGQGEGDLVQSAARSLGGAAGNLLAKNLGKRLGISEISVQDSEEIGGSAFTVGQYLSPRLYLSYGVGLFEPGEVLTLRYRISEKWNLEASQGPESQKAGINYRVEKR